MNVPSSYRYRVVDVFTTRQFEGNALAVFTDARGLDGAVMQRIARELNLSETVFIDPPNRLRIFTPARELAFAGHPTIGTAFVLFDEGAARDGKLVLEETIGPVPVRVEHGDPPMFWLTTPPMRVGRTFDRAACAAALGLGIDDLLDVEPQVVDAGNPALFIALRDKEAVDRASTDLRAIEALRGGETQPGMIFFFTPTAEGAYSRMFAPEYGVVEDPATGSATGPLALYMRRNGLVSGTRFVSEQGTKMGRRSFLHVNVDGDAIEVGGHATPVAEATLTLT